MSASVPTDPQMSKIMDVPGPSPLGGYVYVLQFSTGVVKVGQTGDPTRRLGEHAKEAHRFGHKISRHWVSVPHYDHHENEQKLIVFCEGKSPRVRDVAKGEYFQEDIYAEVLKFANKLTFKVLSQSERDEQEARAEKAAHNIADVFWKADQKIRRENGYVPAMYLERETWEYTSVHGMYLHTPDYASRCDHLMQQMMTFTALQVHDFGIQYKAELFSERQIYRIGDRKYYAIWRTEDGGYLAPMDPVAYAFGISVHDLADFMEESEYAVLWTANSREGIYDTEMVSDKCVRRLTKHYGLPDPIHVT